MCERLSIFFATEGLQFIFLPQKGQQKWDAPPRSFVSDLESTDLKVNKLYLIPLLVLVPGPYRYVSPFSFTAHNLISCVLIMC